jgi:hypothetical protein
MYGCLLFHAGSIKFICGEFIIIIKTGNDEIVFQFAKAGAVLPAQQETGILIIPGKVRDIKKFAGSF